MSEGMTSTEAARSQLKFVVDIGASVAIIAVCTALTWNLLAHSPAPAPVATGSALAVPTRPDTRGNVPTAPISLNGDEVDGQAASAKVALIEYSDFQCPYCGKFARETLPAIRKEYVRPGKLLLAFRSFPLVQIHQSAMNAATAAFCAGEQGQFWQMHDGLFANQAKLDTGSIAVLARTLGLRQESFSKCLAAGQPGQVRDAMLSAQALSVGGTPTFFVGTLGADRSVQIKERFSGALSVKQFESILDPMLSESGAQR
jgi:protein-disulfide isomerase